MEATGIIEIIRKRSQENKAKMDEVRGDSLARAGYALAFVEDLQLIDLINAEKAKENK